MSSLSDHSTDARQSPEWRDYLSQIGWKNDTALNTPLSIRNVPLLNHTIIKITHPDMPLPFKELEQKAKQYNALFTLIEPHVRGYSEQEFITNGYQKSKMKVAFSASRLIDISQPLNDIFKTFSESARRNIKKAQILEIQTRIVEKEEMCDSHYFDDYYSLYKTLGSMKGFYVLSRDEMYKKFKAFQNSSFLAFAYPKGSSTPIAVVWFAWVNQTLIYMHTGITQEGYQNFCNYLLVFEGIKHGKTKNCLIFDFESVYDDRFPKENKKWKGYSEFKSRFHGELVQYPQGWVKIYNPIYKALYLCGTLFS